MCPEDFRFYRRAVYQNRVMDVEEVRLRMIAEDTAAAELERTVEEQSARIGLIFGGGPRVAFLAFPTVPHLLRRVHEQVCCATSRCLCGSSLIAYLALVVLTVAGAR